MGRLSVTSPRSLVVLAVCFAAACSLTVGRATASAHPRALIHRAQPDPAPAPAGGPVTAADRGGIPHWQDGGDHGGGNGQGVGNGRGLGNGEGDQGGPPGLQVHGNGGGDGAGNGGGDQGGGSGEGGQGSAGGGSGGNGAGDQGGGGASNPGGGAQGGGASTPTPPRLTTPPVRTSVKSPPRDQAGGTQTSAGGRATRQGVGSAARQAAASSPLAAIARALGSGLAATPGARGGKAARQSILGLLVDRLFSHGKKAPSAGPRRPKHQSPNQQPAVARTLERIVRTIPLWVKAAIAVLALLALVGAVAYFFVARTARYLRRHRETLLGEIGVLQAALLPEVPETIGGLLSSVAYRPAEGLAAGGDFYDVFPLDDQRVGILIGDVCGHGRAALMRTSLLRHTMRAYLDADLTPREALQVGGRVLDKGSNADEFATVVLATYDPGSQELRYASAGHPHPLFLGQADHAPVTQASSPPVGAGLPTGLRQTTVSLSPGNTFCFFTDGLIEARQEEQLLGRLGLRRLLAELGDGATAAALLGRVSQVADRVCDDMAAGVFRVADGVQTPALRIEELEILDGDVEAGILGRFLAACGLPEAEIYETARTAQDIVSRFSGAVVRVFRRPDSLYAEVVPANVEHLAVHRAAV